MDQNVNQLEQMEQNVSTSDNLHDCNFLAELLLWYSFSTIADKRKCRWPELVVGGWGAADPQPVQHELGECAEQPRVLTARDNRGVVVQAKHHPS